MKLKRGRPVIVGYDSSSAAMRAMEVAGDEAAAAGVPLVVVHAYPWPILYASLANVPYSANDWEPAPEVLRVVEAAARRATARQPDLRVEVSVRAGTGGETLVNASADASLVVLGATGASGVAGLLSGSVASSVAAHAHCPVMVVRQAPPGRGMGGEVCVGVDGTESSLGALRFAADWAAARGATVRALYALDEDAADPAFGLDAPAQQRLRDWVEASGADVREVAVIRRPAAQALLAASTAARLVVVGSRHRGGLASLALGSVGHSLIRHATCPVVIVHGWSAEPTAQPGAERVDTISA